MFEFDQFSKKQCSSLFDELFSKSGEALQDLMFDICSFEAKNRVFMFDHQQMNTFGRSSLFDVRIMMLEFVQCLIKWCSSHHYNLLLTNFILGIFFVKDQLSLQKAGRHLLPRDFSIYLVYVL